MNLKREEKGNVTEYSKDDCDHICYTTGKMGQCLQQCSCLKVKLGGLECAAEQENKEDWK